MVQSLSAAGLWRTRSCLRAWMRRSGRQSSLLWVPLFMVVGVWCVYLAGMEYDYQMEKRRYRNKR